MAIHKLQIDDFVTIDYELIAIHSSIEDYRLAYFINQNLHLLLEKSRKDISVKSAKAESCFSRFIFEDADTDITWNLIQNKSSTTVAQQKNVPISLFSEAEIDITTSSHLLPELKKVDYILKVENKPSFFMPSTLINKLLGIKHITTAYTIEHNKLKSKNNLIF
ncbi:IPExxxVDY family protein [Flavobacterium arcticum]|uniref:IPExxxVDY family protein n=1 Tax=Flavobacterium arcticum TaxID=1784713 RepID=A0A345HBP1_9FLAO|nr:IPExxxVDY family protein [Flavobacterium arcticum]AXG74001.1 IPExxxVDY family protein [Flavobacterium arcticum]KAF2508979.1 IPExxxVDY family protein [Flavobacterium arcticum]